jgi:hypothetical protein
MIFGCTDVRLHLSHSCAIYVLLCNRRPPTQNWPGTFWAPSGADTDAAMIANAIIEGNMSIPTVLHIGGPRCPAPTRDIARPGPLGGPIEFAIASYLIVASAGTTLSVSTGWEDADFCWWPEWDVEYVYRS